MNVKELKELLSHYPDETLVVIHGHPDFSDDVDEIVASEPKAVFVDVPETIYYHTHNTYKDLDEADDGINPEEYKIVGAVKLTNSVWSTTYCDGAVRGPSCPLPDYVEGLKQKRTELYSQYLEEQEKHFHK